MNDDASRPKAREQSVMMIGGAWVASAPPAGFDSRPDRSSACVGFDPCPLLIPLVGVPLCRQNRGVRGGAQRRARGARGDARPPKPREDFQRRPLGVHFWLGFAPTAHHAGPFGVGPRGARSGRSQWAGCRGKRGGIEWMAVGDEEARPRAADMRCCSSQRPSSTTHDGPATTVSEPVLH